jgi:predicted DNA-binding transcriptional regulator AlpA
MSGQVVDLQLRRQIRTGTEPWLSKQQIATHVGFSVRWVELRVAEGMPCRRMGGRLRFQRSSVEAWLEQRRQAS